MKKRTKKHVGVGYYLWYGISYLHALLPLSALYILSDALYFFLYYLARYRRKVVRKNLTNTFPSKSKKEIEKIEKDFYRFLCDYFVETIKLLHISDKEIKQRMKFDNPELINELT
ncbi:MAG: acetyltransferase, partial [Dysgonamonadaceae bacterium]